MTVLPDHAYRTHRSRLLASCSSEGQTLKQLAERNSAVGRIDHNIITLARRLSAQGFIHRAAKAGHAWLYTITPAGEAELDRLWEVAERAHRLKISYRAAALALEGERCA